MNTGTLLLCCGAVCTGIDKQTELSGLMGSENSEMQQSTFRTAVARGKSSTCSNIVNGQEMIVHGLMQNCQFTTCL